MIARQVEVAQVRIFSILSKVPTPATVCGVRSDTLHKQAFARTESLKHACQYLTCIAYGKLMPLESESNRAKGRNGCITRRQWLCWSARRRCLRWWYSRRLWHHVVLKESGHYIGIRPEATEADDSVSFIFTKEVVLHTSRGCVFGKVPFCALTLSIPTSPQDKQLPG